MFLACILMFSNCNKKYVHKTLRIRTYCRDVEKKETLNRNGSIREGIE